MSAPAPAMLVIGKSRFAVSTLEEASARYERFRGHKSSRLMKDGEVLDSAGNLIARVSYNAKVWPPEEWHRGQEPLFNPYAEARS